MTLRIDRVYIDGFRNLAGVEADFDEGRLTTVIIGQNGSGKSNLIEAIVEIFRHVDLPSGSVRFTFEIDYVIRNHKVRIQNREGTTKFLVDNEAMSFSRFNRNKDQLFPDLIFGYSSGTGRGLEALFDRHQSDYYNVIKDNVTRETFDEAKAKRRLFYCRPVHGALSLLAQFGHPGKNPQVASLLQKTVGVKGFHSALALLKQPSWFVGSGVEAKRQADSLWGAHGPAGECARALRRVAFQPMVVEAAKVVDDYRKKPKSEAQVACFVRDEDTLQRFAKHFNNDREMFEAMEAADISDLFREVVVWVTRQNDASGDISFGDLSDGERQLLMVLGLIRVSRGREALFLLDEPDTHLNPAWQLTYLNLIQEWTEVAANKNQCQIIMTSHNPLTIAALTKEEVRVMQKGEGEQIKFSAPYADPRGMGFTSTLTEIFGLPTTLDPKTQATIDKRNTLSRLNKRTEEQEQLLIEINDKLNRLGFMNESREPLYHDFLRAWQDVQYSGKPPLTPQQIQARHEAMKTLIKQLSAETQH